MARISKPDVVVWNRGASVVMVQPVSKKAKAWVRDNVNLEGWQWMGSSFACEPRMLDNLLYGMESEGLVVS